MIEFIILKTSKRTRARIGLLKTSHGIIETPCLVPVATQAVVKTLTSEEVQKTKTQVLIANTFHLHLKPGERVIQKLGGLHGFMNWKKPLMTDSGGFQVFSLGFGLDLGIGKLSQGKARNLLSANTQPQKLRITNRGVYFRSPISGANLFLGPQESIQIQEKLGADIMFAFDECPPPNASKAYVRQSLERTHHWAKISLETRRSKQALFGIVQGGGFKDLRQRSAQFIARLPFEGFGVGGEFGSKKQSMANMIRWVNNELPERKPRHLLGIGHPEDIPVIIKAGVDFFDCIVPTHYGRHGTTFTSQGRLDLMKSTFLKDKKPLDPQCGCEVCHQYTRSYISHLFRAKEITAMRLTTFHNLFYFNAMVERYRWLIKKGRI